MEAHATVILERCLNMQAELSRQEQAGLSNRWRFELLHDLNNAVSIMLGKSQPRAESGKCPAIVDQTIEAGRHVFAVFGAAESAKQPQAITDIVYDTADQQLYIMGANVELSDGPAQRRMLIPLSSAAYTRVLLNLILNAQDAMPKAENCASGVQAGT